MIRAFILLGLALALLSALACGGEAEPTAKLILAADLSQVPPGTDPDEVLGEAADILRQRARNYGIAEPEVSIGGDTIIVGLKGIDEAGALEFMTARGRLEFKREQITTDGLVVCRTLQGEEFGVQPQNVNPDPASRSLARCLSLDKLGEPIWVDAEVDGGDGTAVRLTQEHVERGSWVVRDDDRALSLRFTSDGGALLQTITSFLTGYHLGLFLDGELIAAPRIQRAITDGTAVVSGFPAGKARIFAAVLNAPPLPLPLVQSP